MEPFVPSDFSAPNTAPTLRTTHLSEDEAKIATWMSQRLADSRSELLQSNLYYKGLQQMTDLGISIPPELRGLRQVLGWSRIGINARNERLTVQGFRLPDSTSTNQDIWDIWQYNNLDEEAPLAHCDSMIFGSTPIVVGPGDGKGDQPIITVESPLEMTVNWNHRKRASTAAFQTYADRDITSDTYGRQLACLYLPGSTIHLVQGSKGWEILERNDYDNIDGIPVVLMANRPSVANRLGSSEIDESWRGLMDYACRTYLGMEVAREFFAAPQRYIIGASEEAFQDADGDTLTAWETYIGRITALETDEHGNLPTVGTWETGDPSNFTKLLSDARAEMASLTALPPQYFGIFSDGNPASADAIRMSDFRLKMCADQLAVSRSGNWEDVVRLALLIRDGKLPEDAHQLETDWAPTGIPTPAADTDAIVKQIQAGVIPADSDVALEKLGYSAVERERIVNSRKRAQGKANLDAILGVGQPSQAPVTTDALPLDQQPGANG